MVVASASVVKHQTVYQEYIVADEFDTIYFCEGEEIAYKATCISSNNYNCSDYINKVPYDAKCGEISNPYKYKYSVSLEGCWGFENYVEYQKEDKLCYTHKCSDKELECNRLAGNYKFLSSGSQVFANITLMVLMLLL